MSISVSDLKSTLNFSTTAYDAGLTIALDSANQYIGTALGTTATAGRFIEWHPFTGPNQDTIYIMGKCTDASIVELIAYDAAFSAYTIDSALYQQTGPCIWRFLPTSARYNYQRYKITYTSNILMRAIDNIVQQVALYEFIKLPGQQGFLAESSKSAGGVVTQSFKSDDEFYSGVRSRLNTIFVPAV